MFGDFFLGRKFVAPIFSYSGIAHLEVVRVCAAGQGDVDVALRDEVSVVHALVDVVFAFFRPDWDDVAGRLQPGEVDGAVGEVDLEQRDETLVVRLPLKRWQLNMAKDWNEDDYGSAAAGVLFSSSSVQLQVPAQIFGASLNLP